MPRYIDAESYVKQYKGNILTAQTDYAEGFRNALEDVENAPTADVVKVVRCRECRFSEEIDPGLYICHNENIKIVGSYVEPDWYCADGKRKETKDE